MKIKACYELVFYYAVFVILLPLLLLQGIWVRFKTIKLPEATGERSGYYASTNTSTDTSTSTDINANAKHNNETVKLLILGDSAAAGVGVNQQKQALAGQLPPLLAKQHSITWQLVASSGLTSSDIIKQLTLLPTQTFDLVLVSVGVNDVTHFTHQAQWAENISHLATMLTTKFSADKVLFSSVPPMHLFTALPQPLRWWLGLRASKLNALMATVLVALQQHSSVQNTDNQGVNKHTNKCAVLTVDLPFKPEYLAKDGMHPSTLAYRVWAKQAAEQFSEWFNTDHHKNKSHTNHKLYKQK